MRTSAPVVTLSGEELHASSKKGKRNKSLVIIAEPGLGVNTFVIRKGSTDPAISKTRLTHQALLATTSASVKK